MKLICPPKNWREPIEIDAEQLHLVNDIAKRLHLTINVNDKQNKVYLGMPATEPIKAVFTARLPRHADTSIIDGVLMLDGRQYKACSGAPGCQVYGIYFGRGTPIPPGVYDIDLAGYYCATPGIEGRYYHILPDPIYSADKTKKRTEIGLHREAGDPGTAGCIGIVGKDFDALDAVLRKLFVQQKTLRLEVSYLCRD